MKTDRLEPGHPMWVSGGADQYAVDIGGILERTRELARTAVLGSPWATFTLSDVMPDDVWVNVLSSPEHALAVVLAAFDGCASALGAGGVSLVEVRLTPTTPPLGSAVTEEDCGWRAIGSLSPAAYSPGRDLTDPLRRRLRSAEASRTLTV